MSDPVAERLAAAADDVRRLDAERAAALDDRVRAIVWAQGQGWSVRQIAAAMGLPAGSVQADLRRGAR